MLGGSFSLVFARLSVSDGALSLQYTKRQMAFRTAILYSGSQFGNAIAGLLAIGLLKLDGAHGLEGWVSEMLIARAVLRTLFSDHWFPTTFLAHQTTRCVS